jgi:hypothetical protein
MSKLKIKDIPYLEAANSNLTGGARFGVRDEFYIGENKFKAAILFDFQADLTIKPKQGKFGTDYGYIYGAVVGVGKNATVSLGGGVSV